MKTLLTKLSILFITISITSCGGGGGDTPPPPPPVNKAPSVPSLVSPTNGLLCINNIVDFSWNSSVDPEGDNINYEIVIAKDSQFNIIVKQETTAALTKSYTLEKGTPYYWKVKAVDAKSASSVFTSSWGFYTEGIGVVNYAPFATTLVKPAINSTFTGTSVELEWIATDLDNDALKYDIYFGTTDTFITALVVDQTAKTYTKTGLTLNTTYYWRIDVKDTKGGKATGQVWSFKTSS